MSRETIDAFESPRRTLMKAIGAGSALVALGGSAEAQGDHGNGTVGDDTEDGVDPRGDDGESRTGAVHRIETLITGPATHPERPADFFYQPTGIHVEPGDVLKFVFVTPDHNVVSYHPAFGMQRRVPRGVPPISSPLMGWKPASIPGDRMDPPAEIPGAGGGRDDDRGPDRADDAGPVPDVWLQEFDTPGVYDLLCSPHEAFGMAMRVVVGDVTDTRFETDDPENLPEPRAGPVGLARATLTDPALQPSNVVDEGRVLWEDLEVNRSDGEED